MEEDNCAQTALDVMADMLKERGYDYSYAPELEGTSLIYRDKAGNYHDCWGAGSSELVNVPIAVTPEQALSVDDLNGIIDENAKLREEIAKARDPQRIGGQADPSSFVYAIEQLREFRWQHATNDEDVIPYINNVVAAHERENVKLRAYAQQLYKCIKLRGGRCQRSCPHYSGMMCDLLTPGKLELLGIEVPDGS